MGKGLHRLQTRKQGSPYVCRGLGLTDIMVSPVALGCWPISGMTSLDVNDADSVATIAACLDVGICFLDTAFSYGAISAHGSQPLCRHVGQRSPKLPFDSK